MTTTTLTTGGGAAIQGNVTAGTVIGRDQIIVLGDYTAAQLETVLTRLREVLSHPGAELRADLAHSRLTVTAPDTPPITLSEQAAKALWPVAARQADDRAYLTALRLDPRYGRWAQQFVALAGILTTRELPPGWADIPPEFTALEVVGEGAQQQIRRVPLDDITQAIAQHAALVLLGAPGCGKTTTLQRLALDAARQRLTGQPGPLPLFLPLAEYRDYRAPYDFLVAKWNQQVGTADLPHRLRQGDLLLLCDALNEMLARDSADYRARVGAWRLVRQGFPAQDERPRYRLELPGFHIGQYPVTNAEYGGFIDASDYTDGRNDPEAEGRPVVRGGSWFDDFRAARGACRLRSYPGSWLDRGGLRVVVSLADSGC